MEDPLAAFDSEIRPPLALSQRRKAALIVQLMISDGGNLALSQLPPRLQELLAREIGAIRLVDRDTVNAVADEFSDLLGAIGLAGAGGVAAVDALSSSISPEVAGRLKAEFGGAMASDPWAQLGGLAVEDLTQILLSESIEVAAVVLSKLPVATAAEILGALPGDRARMITIAVSRTSAIKPEYVDRIGKALVAAYCGKPESAFEKPPAARVGAILNSSPAVTRESVLEGLESEDKSFAKGVRRVIFTFVDIPNRVEPIDIPPAMRGVDQDSLITGIAAALMIPGQYKDAAEFILSNLSQRMAANIREEALEKGKVKDDVGEEAMKEITNGIRALADTGAITLLDPEEEEEDAA